METRVRTIHDWFWFYAWLDEKVREFNLSQSCSEVMQTKYLVENCTCKSNLIQNLFFDQSGSVQDTRGFLFHAAGLWPETAQE